MALWTPGLLDRAPTGTESCEALRVVGEARRPGYGLGVCVNCVSTTEVVAGHLALAAAVLRQPVHNLLASAGLVAPLDVVVRDVRTVAFLRSLELDPVEILGPAAVAAADAWVPTAYEPRPSARPIGSQSLLTAT